MLIEKLVSKMTVLGEILMIELLMCGMIVLLFVVVVVTLLCEIALV